MASVGPGDVRELLDGYGIDTTEVKDSWIRRRINRRVIPMVNEKIGFDIAQTVQEEVVEFHSGTNESTLQLDTRNATELIRVEILDTVETTQDQRFILVPREGFIKSQNSDEFLNTPAFPKGNRNIRVTLKVGFIVMPDDVKEMIAAFAAEAVLAHLMGRDGGGASLSVVSWSKSYGERGKYTEARQDLLHTAFIVLRRFTTAVVGQGGRE